MGKQLHRSRHIVAPTHLAESAERRQNEPIAIIGIGCRFPGGVHSPQTFWQLLRDGVDAITEIPSDRFDVAAFHDPHPATPGKIMSRWGGFLEQIDRFDASFFGISPREAERLDPQQRLLLEVAWEALEDAGQVASGLAGGRSGVFIGLWLNDYEARLFADPSLVDFYMTTGSGRYSASGRLSYAFGLQGPGITVDTACSSSLVAVHLACQSLWRGESTLALAGGANTILQPHITIAYSQSKMMAPDGRCKFGDARGDGYVRSEGAGVIALKTLSQALADGDPIYALILGSAVNNDGRSGEYMATPAVDGQAEVLRLAYADAGVSPGDVVYVEAHGTGTRAGDPVELTALGSVLATERPPQQRCAVGSVKTNLGHTEGAAGIAGLIKVALSLQHRAIPANLHFQEPNPDVPWETLPLFIPTEMTPIPQQGQQAVAGVSSFGIAGTNAHVVLAEAPAPGVEERPSATLRPPYILPVSGHTPEALWARAQAFRELLSAAETPSLSDICYTAAVRRTHHEHRLALVAGSREALVEQLQAMAENEMGMAQQPPLQPKVAFIFPGQGSQWLGMGRELLSREPVFHRALQQCEAAMRPFVDWSLMEQLAAAEDAPHYRLDQIDVIQPTLLAIEIALAELWRAWGVMPDAVIGHSMGEVAAAYIAGALSLEDAMRVICHRSRLLRRTSGQGAMAVVDLTAAEAQEALAGYEDRLSIAVSNSPRSTVLSGDPAALDELIARLESRDVFCRLIKVDVASHSPQMDPLTPDLLAVLQLLQPRPAQIPIYSTALGVVSDGADFDAAYWVQNLRRPVLFSSMTQQLLSDGHTVFIEMSPHPVLLPAVQQGIQHAGAEGLVLSSLRRHESEAQALLDSLAALYVAGFDPAWEQLYPAGRTVSLPTYPWQRERFWYEAAPSSPAMRRPGAHPLLGRYLASAAGSHIWETDLSASGFPYLQDHRLGETAVLPAAAVVEMTLAAAREAYGPGSHTLHNVVFQEALLLPADAVQTVQLVISGETPNVAAFQLFARSAQDEQGQTPAWLRYAAGSIRLHGGDEDARPQAGRATPETAVSGDAHYRAMTARGLHYGPAFQGVNQIQRRPDGVTADLQLPQAAGAAAGYHLHPTLLDAAFQLLVATLDDDAAAGDLYLPVALERLWMNPNPGDPDRWHGRAVRHAIDDDLVGDVFLLDDEGRLQAAAYGLRLQRLPQQAAAPDQWFYRLSWEPHPLPEAAPATPAPGRWLILAAENDLAREAAAHLQLSGSACLTAAPGEVFKQVAPAAYSVNPTEPDSWRQLLSAAVPPDGKLDGILYLWGLDNLGDTDLHAAQERGVIGLLHLVQAIAAADLATTPRLWLATHGVQAAAGETTHVAQSPLWGLARVLAGEHPELNCSAIDLDEAATAATLLAEIAAATGEKQVAYRHGRRYVARLAGYQPQTTATSDSERTIEYTAGQNYRLEMPAPGILDQLRLYTAERRPPQPHEVEIEVAATGLNFIDVMKAMGIYPGLDPDRPPALGAECAGVVTAVGAEVNGLRAGDEVIAITPSFDDTGLFSAYVTVPATLVVPKTARFSLAEAATLPINFLTAYYALHHLGRMSTGERVLIHSAAGGVGLAAVQLAQLAGAEIFATAGSPEKRAYLRELGVAHVMDSRSHDFARQVLELTDGRGVDLVLNSLTGEALRHSFALLAPYGRFLEIGKRDIYQNNALGLEPFKKNLSFFAIDLARVIAERPAFICTLLQELLPHFESGHLRPLPLQTYPIAAVDEAFRYMAQARHTGKIVVTHQKEDLSLFERRSQGELRADATYLITGGLGGLGLLVARWLAERGARSLALLGRSAPTQTAKQAIAELQEQGVQVAMLAADVSDKTALAGALQRIRDSMPPLRGIIHAAGLLDDSTMLQMDSARFRRALAPKLHGSWHLHTLTTGDDLDFFIMFSSVAALLGTPGQGNYAAANSFLDALAHYRRGQGLPALSINWGPWSEVGLAAAEANRGRRLAQQGLASLSPAQGLAALQKLWGQDTAQAAVMAFDLQRWAQAYPTSHNDTLFSELRQTSGAAGPETETADIRGRLLAAEPGRPRRSLFEKHLREQVAQVLRLPPARIPLTRPLKTLGLDSLMTLELRNRLEASLGLSLSATFIFNYPTVTALAPYLADKMGISLETAATPATTVAAAPPMEAETGDLEDLSMSDVEAQLAAELDSIEDLLYGG